MTQTTEKAKKRIPDPELPPEQCQHIRIIDVNKPVQRVFYECYHCSQGLITECSGKPTMEEYNGRRQEKQIKIQCPSCGKSAIKLITGSLISTTAILSPWKTLKH